MDDFWDQPRIATEFGVSPNTVESSWRNATLKTVREHLAAAGLSEADMGCDARKLTRLGWEPVRKRLGLGPLRLPNIALPLPDLVLANKPAWTQASVQKWADETGRRGDAGQLCRSSPPGRPEGIIETRPRRRAEATS